MKANYLDMNRGRRMLKDKIKSETSKYCEKCLEDLNRQHIEASKYNAMFHTLHLCVVLHDEFGFGKVRLQRLLDAYAAEDASFKEDLSDGVAWTKTRRRLEEIGLEFSREDIQIANVKERLYEKGITYNKKV